MYLDKNCKKILKLLIKHYNNSNFYIDKRAIEQICNINSYQCSTSLNYLLSINYIETIPILNDSNVVCYHPTISGKNHFINQRRNIYMFLSNSIFCPIIVSIITTLITLLIKSQ